MDGASLLVIIAFIAVLVGAARVIIQRARRADLMKKYNDELIVDGIMQKRFWQGMTQEMLIDSLGRPVDVATKVLKAKTVYTFKYNQTGRNRFGTRIRVEDGFVVGWEQK